MSKRSRGNYVTGYAAKRQRRQDEVANMYTNMPRGTNQRQVIKPYRLYTPRTPGGQIVSERKYFDLHYNGSSISNIDGLGTWSTAEEDPTQNCLFCPIQGNDITQREGRSVFVHKITVRGSVYSEFEAAGTAPPINSIFRLILVLDKQTNGTQMDPSDLITSGNGAPQLFAFQNTASFGRFQILKDIYIQPPQPNLGSGLATFAHTGNRSHFNLKYTFREPLRVNFNNGNTGSVADIVDNSFHMIVGKEGGPNAFLYYQCRVSFTG